MSGVNERLAEIEQRANAATRGPWSDQHESWAGKGAVLNGDGHPIAVCGEDTPETGYHQATNDRAFIAHARADVPFLLDQLREVEQAHTLMATQFRIMQAEKEHGWREAEKHEAALTRVRVLLDSLGEFADNHATHSADCHTWHPECLVIKLRRALDGEVPS